MIKPHPLLPLFKKFILHSKSGKRLNKNGTRIKIQTIDNYSYCEKLLTDYELHSKSTLVLFETRGHNKREHNSLKKYWAKFYKNFTGYLYKEKNCHDNYVGQNIKMIRTFFNWLNSSLGIHTGDFHKSFYILKEDIPILTLSLDQLKFLVSDTNFESSLSKPLQQSKDVFVVGCMVGLRFSDLRRIKKENIEYRDQDCYLKMRSQKTDTETLVKLPTPVIKIFEKYKRRKGVLLPTVSLFCFNSNIKKIAELAGWTTVVPKNRTKKGISKPKFSGASNTGLTRYCDLISSHTMRRTSITTMLTSGMPEYVVRQISGHTSDSKAFFRYVNLAQKLMDQEINKMHAHFQ